jgi:hypothetical protein
VGDRQGKWHRESHMEHIYIVKEWESAGGYGCPLLPRILISSLCFGHSMNKLNSSSGNRHSRSLVGPIVLLDAALAVLLVAIIVAVLVVVLTEEAERTCGAGGHSSASAIQTAGGVRHRSVYARTQTRSRALSPRPASG